MKPNERLYKGYRQVSSDIDLNKAVIFVDSVDFKKPSTISLETVGNALQLKIDDDINSKNICAVDSSDLDKNPTTIPAGLLLSKKTHISVDENYVYFWIAKIGKWKRIPLSDWPQS